MKLRSLLNAGPFVMTGRLDDMKNRYGRDLRCSTAVWLTDDAIDCHRVMRESGLARRYVGRKSSWC